jgi:hypothetical protein
MTRLVDWVTAIGTAAAAILALYFGAIQPRWRRPKLRLAREDPFVANTTIGGVPNVPAWWIRVEVTLGPITSENRPWHWRRWWRWTHDPALDVEAVIVSVVATGSRGETRCPKVAGFPLQWTASDRATTVIPKGLPRYLNVAMCDPRPDEGGPRLFLVFDGAVVPHDNRHVWTEQWAELVVAVTARNSRPVTLRLRIRRDDDRPYVFERKRKGLTRRLKWPSEAAQLPTATTTG